ncbi:MAG: hypothetical protein IPK99_15770, partial [Flavobacteriales bacterium]|nr:hypothetical protein [Flavobacteriales bacterium]
ACTAFILHEGGRTFVGNNEDSWCVEGRVRFVPGEAGRLGAVYFSSWRGHPYLPWSDQLGMNEAGLVFDGLTVQPKDVAPAPGKPLREFSALTNRVLEQCRNVPEAVAFLRRHDLALLHKSMIFLADAQGRYAVVQNDTILMGDAPYFAVGNWRLGRNTDMDAIPIPRLQQGRALLEAGVAPTVDGAWTVLEGMKSYRKFLENGTFFSTLFEPDSGRVHLAFYHDYDHLITFDLREELQKGAHTLDLPSLFPPNKAYQALQAYRTPFHQRWLFQVLMFLGGAAVLWGFILGVWVLVNGCVGCGGSQCARAGRCCWPGSGWWPWWRWWACSSRWSRSSTSAWAMCIPRWPRCPGSYWWWRRCCSFGCAGTGASAGRCCRL